MNVLQVQCQPTGLTWVGKVDVSRIYARGRKVVLKSISSMAVTGVPPGVYSVSFPSLVNSQPPLNVVVAWETDAALSIVNHNVFAPDVVIGEFGDDCWMTIELKAEDTIASVPHLLSLAQNENNIPNYGKNIANNFTFQWGYFVSDNTTNYTPHSDLTKWTLANNFLICNNSYTVQNVTNARYGQTGGFVFTCSKNDGTGGGASSGFTVGYNSVKFDGTSVGTVELSTKQNNGSTLTSAPFNFNQTGLGCYPFFQQVCEQYGIIFKNLEQYYAVWTNKGTGAQRQVQVSFAGTIDPANIRYLVFAVCRSSPGNLQTTYNNFRISVTWRTNLGTLFQSSISSFGFTGSAAHKGTATRLDLFSIPNWATSGIVTHMTLTFLHGNPSNYATQGVDLSFTMPFLFLSNEMPSSLPNIECLFSTK